MIAETEVDTEGAALGGGDQLWFATRYAPGLGTARGVRSPVHRQGRFELKRHRARAVARARHPLSEHLIDPWQLQLFPTPTRQWNRLDYAMPRAMTPAAAQLVEDFTTHIGERGWNVDSFRGSIRTLRIIVTHLGAQVPVQETDIRALTAAKATLHGARLINYLRLRGILEAQPAVDPHLARARFHADSLDQPSFAAAVHRWLDVLLGQGSTPSRARKPKTAETYARCVLPTLNAWSAAGIHDLREVTRQHVLDALKPLSGSQAGGLHSALRSMFRALKREQMIFRDPARGVSLTRSRALPVCLSDGRISGILDRVPDARGKLMVALVAVHALFPGQLQSLLQSDLDRARGTLRVQRPGRTDHIVYLDELTMKIARDWERERHRRWPGSTNPHLFVTRNTAVDDTHPPMSKMVVHKPFQRLTLTASELRTDRILDEARHGSDPIQLIRLFGIGVGSATMYIAAAHPDKGADPIKP